MGSVKKIFLPFLLFLFVFLVYVHNLSLSTYGGDVGDLLGAAVVGGVPHPPGYPLFTLLGFLLTRIKFLTPAFMVGLISAVSSAAGVLLFYYLSLVLTKNRLISFLSASILAFNYLFWFYAEIGEVFALNNFFIILLVLLALKFNQTRGIKYFYALAFSVGLSATNHQTIILIFPSILILIFKHREYLLKHYAILLRSVLLCVAGFSVYLYVPIASSFNPPINWDHVGDLKSFLHLLLRQDYGTFSPGFVAPTPVAEKVIIIKAYLFDILTQLTIPVTVISLIGAIFAFFKNKTFFLSIILGFIISGPLFIGYAGFPLSNNFYFGVNERFFIFSSILILMFFPFGILGVIGIVDKFFRKKTYEALFILVFFILPFYLFYYNFPKTDLHNVWIGNDLAYDLISPLPKNSVLLLSGDTDLFNAWYVHYALNFRPDVQILNLDGLSGDLYYDKQVKEYLKINPKDKVSPDLAVNVISFISQKRPVFTYVEIQRKKGKKLTWLPSGLTQELLSSQKQAPAEKDFSSMTANIWSKFRYKNTGNSIALGSFSIADIPAIYSDALLTTGNYYLHQYKDSVAAYQFYKSALAEDPSDYKVYEVIAAYFSGYKECQKTILNLNQAISLYPFDKVAYYLLYYSYIRCDNAKEAENVAKNYQSIYGNTFAKDLNIYLKNLK